MNIASYIDHTILRVDCTADEVRQVCDEAVQYQFAAVCIPPFYVQLAAQRLKQHLPKINVATVVGFPMGYASTPAKIEEIKRAIDDGADELDAVINICALKEGNWSYVANDIDSMTTAARLKGKKIKIILETGLLNEQEIGQLAEVVSQSEPDFVKTSTGFNGTGAELDKVELLKELLGDKIAIKASGGIRTRAAALSFIQAGASRIGTSSALKLLGA